MPLTVAAASAVAKDKEVTFLSIKEKEKKQNFVRIYKEFGSISLVLKTGRKLG